MTILTFSALLFALSTVAGMLGSLTGLGGGVVLVPALALLFGVDVHYAMGSSLISVIATSSGAAAAFANEGYTNLRIGMFLLTGSAGRFFLDAVNPLRCTASDAAICTT